MRTTDDEAERAGLLATVTGLYLALARALARRYANRGLEREDLEQVACLALVKAIQRFDLTDDGVRRTRDADDHR